MPGLALFLSGTVPVTGSALKTTPLNAIHREMGARMVDFGGWGMPLHYAVPGLKSIIKRGVTMDIPKLFSMSSQKQ